MLSTLFSRLKIEHLIKQIGISCVAKMSDTSVAGIENTQEQGPSSKFGYCSRSWVKYPENS
ncbi:hypothetical protein CWB99_03045 [Pseudoalteromonas rubra]|uniref:Uncharacterized protein n=1 Tax=Pseudoalteromonas rubra TaxID=43658 RepID=A0A5S3WST6_9GAMM|nr:hypothetical protein CWC00_17440 [Pseudoalteromonas rubra]TMP31953.1 hypothetical protein CWB99_03045 [Pseudoalteromonas rubra]